MTTFLGTPSPLSPSMVVPPLSETELARIHLVAERLLSELDLLVKALPVKARRARAMAAHLQIDSNITQRMCAALAGTQDPIGALTRLPGVKSLRALASAASQAAILRDPDPLLAAIEQYELLIIECGQSQARLRARVDATLAPASLPEPALTSRPHASADAEQNIRARMYLEAAALAKISYQFQSVITLIAPDPADPKRITQAWVSATIGARLRPGGLPMMIYTFDGAEDAPRNLNPSADSAAPHDPADTGQLFVPKKTRIVHALSSKPIPKLSMRWAEGRIMACIDPAHLATDEPFDLGAASTTSGREHPILSPPEVTWCSFWIRNPMERVVFDVYMHRQLARDCIPSAGVYNRMPRLRSEPLQSWHERLPGELRLELLGPGLEHAGASASPKHAQAASLIFEGTRSNPNDFLGYRLDVLYPIWNTYHVVWFDFRKPEDIVLPPLPDLG